MLKYYLFTWRPIKQGNIILNSNNFLENALICVDGTEHTPKQPLFQFH